MTLADRCSDAFASAQQHKRPMAAAEIQQSLLPPRISRVTGGEMAGKVLPSYEVAGDWIDVDRERRWCLGRRRRRTRRLDPGRREQRGGLGALRASRRSGAGLARRSRDAPDAARDARTAHRDDGDGLPLGSGHAELTIADCGHVAPVICGERDG